MFGYTHKELKKNAHFKFHPGMKCQHVFFSFFHAATEPHFCLLCKIKMLSLQNEETLAQEDDVNYLKKNWRSTTKLQLKLFSPGKNVLHSKSGYERAAR